MWTVLAHTPGMKKEKKTASLYYKLYLLFHLYGEWNRIVVGVTRRSKWLEAFQINQKVSHVKNVGR